MVEVKGRKFTVILREEPEGGYSAQCIELPGVISQGETRKQAITNIREAIEGYLEAFPEELNQLPRIKLHSKPQPIVGQTKFSATRQIYN